MNGCIKNNAGNIWEVTVARTIDEVEAMRDIWQEMKSHQPYPITNSNIDRYLSVVKPQKDEMTPCVFLFRQGQEPVAMVIARLENHELKCKIGYKVVFKASVRSLTVVYGGILGQPSCEECVAILKELMEVLYRREAEVVFFNQLAIDSVMYQVASEVPWFLRRSHFPAFQIHWQTSISGGGGVERKWVSKKHQRDIARCKRNLEKASSGSVEIVCYRKETDIDYIMDVVSEISAWTYKAGMGAQFVDNSLMRSLLQQAARDGWLRAYIMYAGNVPIAYETGAVCDKVYFAEQAGFDPRWKAYGPGTMLQLGIFEDLSANESVDVYDYGFGDAIYKRRFGSKSWPEVSIYIFSRRLYPILLNIVDSLIRGTSLALASLAGKLDLKSKVTRYWRDYLQRRSRQQKKESEEQ